MLRRWDRHLGFICKTGCPLVKRDELIYSCGVRRVLSITLILLFGLPLVAPLFALGAMRESRLPACCRRAGKHQCVMGMAQQAAVSEHSPEAAAPPAQCPYFPKAVAVNAQPSFAMARSMNHFSPWPTRRIAEPQTQSQLDVLHDLSHWQRGPPPPNTL